MPGGPAFGAIAAVGVDRSGLWPGKLLCPTGKLSDGPKRNTPGLTGLNKKKKNENNEEKKLKLKVKWKSGRGLARNGQFVRSLKKGFSITFARWIWSWRCRSDVAGLLLRSKLLLWLGTQRRLSDFRWQSLTAV